VLTLAPPPGRRFELPSLRRVAPAVALAGVAAALAVAGVAGLIHGSSARHAASGPPIVEHGAAVTGKTLQRRDAPTSKSSGLQRLSVGANPSAYGDFAPQRNRLQQYDASLRMRVASQAELSRRTQEALRLTRRLGGYVVTARYSAPGASGTSSLALRIPIEHIQTAIARFSGYGTLVSQRIVLKDLQRHVDTLSARIRKLRAEIAAGGLSQSQLDRDRALLKALTSRRSAAVQRAQLASVALTLAVAPKHKHAAAPLGRFHRTLSNAGNVLVRELEILVYVLLVAGPLLVLGGLAILGGRTLRRRADRRLLERA